MAPRKVALESLPKLHFTHMEVLADPADRAERDHALRTAMALSNSEHEEIGLIAELVGGERVEIISTMIDYESDLVEVKGGFAIPLRAIVRVEL